MSSIGMKHITPSNFNFEKSVSIEILMVNSALGKLHPANRCTFSDNNVQWNIVRIDGSNKIKSEPGHVRYIRLKYRGVDILY
jgi:hypothetical protein